MQLFLFLFFLLLLPAPAVIAQYEIMDAVPAEINFDSKIRDWDGFGFNYVETAQTIDYEIDPQEYGGFSLLSTHDQQKVLEMVFGENGLKPGIVKMFLDPFHQKEPNGPFDHLLTQGHMINFVKRGLSITRQRGGDLTIITTLYGPPPWATRQKILRGRDLNTAQAENLSRYIADWARFLKKDQGLPVKYVSLHNEGEDWERWPADGKSGNIGHGHDYNMYWPPHQVASFIPLMRKTLDAYQLHDVGITPGETTNWYRFYYWGFAEAISSDPEALAGLGLITSHGFYSGNYGRWFGEHNSLGTDLLQEKKPELHAWVTSTSWSKMDAVFIKEMHGNIYTSKVNGIIPWAGIQRPEKWVGGDPNPGCAFRVQENGTLEVTRGYYFYKQVSRAGQPGMAVARTQSESSMFFPIAFASNGTSNPDAFLVVNIGDKPLKGRIRINGSLSKSFHAWRTDPEKEKYKDVGIYEPDAEKIIEYEAPPGSVTTFFGE